MEYYIKQAEELPTSRSETWKASRMHSLSQNRGVLSTMLQPIRLALVVPSLARQVAAPDSDRHKHRGIRGGHPKQSLVCDYSHTPCADVDCWRSSPAAPNATSRYKSSHRSHAPDWPGLAHRPPSLWNPKNRDSRPQPKSTGRLRMRQHWRAPRHRGK